MKKYAVLFIVAMIITAFVACKYRLVNDVDLAIDEFKNRIPTLASVQAGLDFQAELEYFSKTHELNLLQKCRFLQLKNQAKGRLEELKASAREKTAELVVEYAKEEYPDISATVRNNKTLVISGLYVETNVGLANNLWEYNRAGEFYQYLSRDDELLSTLRTVGFQKIVIVNYSDQSNGGKDFVIDLKSVASSEQSQPAQGFQRRQSSQQKERGGEPIQSTNTVRYVSAPSGLNLREKPDPNSKSLGVMPKGAMVTLIVDPSGKKVSFEVEGIRGYWVYVQWGNKKGYAFDGFLSETR